MHLEKCTSENLIMTSTHNGICKIVFGFILVISLYVCVLRVFFIECEYAADFHGSLRTLIYLYLNQCFDVMSVIYIAINTQNTA